MEYWDLYDKNRKKINKVVKRGDYLKDDEYHLVINAWIKNSQDEFLITQRSANKSYAFMWECTGGSALKGETSKEAAIREVKEELGIDVSKSKAKLIGSTLRYYEGCPDILDVWLFECNAKLEDVKVQVEEVNDVMWASTKKIYELYKNNKFEANAFFEDVLKRTKEDVYYIGFNANNAICNDSFFKGSITLYPTKEKGNMFYSKKILNDTKSNEFMRKYHDYIHKVALEKQIQNPNSYFVCFNEKIRNLCEDMNDINIIKNNDEKILNFLNNKFLTREIAKKFMPILNYKYLDTDETYENVTKLLSSNSFVLQADTGAGGDSTYLVNSKKNMPILNDNYSYCVSKYLLNTPLNITLIIYENGILFLPISAQLIKLTNNKFKYVGGDFAFVEKLENDVIRKIKLYSKKLANEIKKMGFRGILGIDYILKDGVVYFMEINPRFQASSFIISKYLREKYNVDIAELHYNALVGKQKDNIKLDKIDCSFLNCNDLEDFSTLKNYETLMNGYFKLNKSSIYRKIFNRSIINELDFEKER